MLSDVIGLPTGWDLDDKLTRFLCQYSRKWRPRIWKCQENNSDFNHTHVPGNSGRIGVCIPNGHVHSHWWALLKEKIMNVDFHLYGKILQIYSFQQNILHGTFAKKSQPQSACAGCERSSGADMQWACHLNPTMWRNRLGAFGRRGEWWSHLKALWWC